MRGCKTIKAVSANWAEQRFIPSVFNSSGYVEEIAIPNQDSFAGRELG